ncbi:hypothetical protein GIB67_026049 [Kingdonia uniflora]|uniref:DUF4283 domain-containing protein n=1 Tax=Kingdonia uniflora TaxID=39325 RepID=A0A7J7M2U3_9MAGN|nr:hypothetical protein GIB67_026049 [Kingdonia uniflora]
MQLTLTTNTDATANNNPTLTIPSATDNRRDATQVLHGTQALQSKIPDTILAHMTQEQVIYPWGFMGKAAGEVNTTKAIRPEQELMRNQAMGRVSNSHGKTPDPNGETPHQTFADKVRGIVTESKEPTGFIAAGRRGRTVQAYSRTNWKIKGTCKLIPICKRFFIIKLESEEDKIYIWNRGLWMVEQMPMRLMPWNPFFSVDRHCNSNALIWCKFPGLPIEMWIKQIIMSLGKTLGTPIQLDHSTQNQDYGYHVNLNDSYLNKNKLKTAQGGAKGSRGNQGVIIHVKQPQTKDMGRKSTDIASKHTYLQETLKESSTASPPIYPPDMPRPANHLHQHEKILANTEWSRAKSSSKQPTSPKENSDASTVNMLTTLRDVEVNIEQSNSTPSREKDNDPSPLGERRTKDAEILISQLSKYVDNTTSADSAKKPPIAKISDEEKTYLHAIHELLEMDI